MDLLKLTDIIQNMIKDTENTTGNNLDLKADTIIKLQEYCDVIKKSGELLQNYIDNTSKVILTEAQKVQNKIQNKIQKLNKTETTQVSPKPTYVPKSYKDIITDVKTPVPLPQQSHLPVKREVAKNVFIEAYTISMPDDCKKHLGFWCYHIKNNRFYISINNNILEAITTNILPSEVTPYKCLEHNNSKSKTINWRTSQFYIPKCCNNESEDIRNITNRMVFYPASKELPNNIPYAIRLGSKDTLYDDALHINDMDYRLFTDYTGNYLLCFTAANQLKNT